MTVAMLHSDGTTCLHEGGPQATVHDDGGPACPAGEQITHVRYNGRVLTITEAYAAFSSIAETITKAIAPLAEAFVEFGRRLGTDPSRRLHRADEADLGRRPDRGQAYSRRPRAKSAAPPVP